MTNESLTLAQVPHEPRYFARMAKAVATKAELMAYAVGTSMLDVGAGGGEVALEEQAAGFNVVALDAAPEAVAQLRAKGLTTVEGYAEDVASLFPASTFDNVLLGSLLHEVYSYAPLGTGTAHLQETIAGAYTVLKSGGRLLVRDVVRSAPEGEGTLLLTTAGAALAREYLRLSPFAGGQVRCEWLSPTTLAGDLPSLTELLYTINWGAESLVRESQELYSVMTQSDYVELFESTGFRMVTTELAPPGGYRKYLAPIGGIYDEMGEEVWPPATCVWVAEKP